MVSCVVCGMLFEMFGMWNFWYVGLSRCVMSEILDVQNVRCFWTMAFGMWEVGDMGCLECGLFRKWNDFGMGMWDIYRVVGC